MSQRKLMLLGEHRAVIVMHLKNAGKNSLYSGNAEVNHKSIYYSII